MNALVPFGKYRGQPVEVMAQDEAYVDWLLGQEWVKARYQNIYNVIINNFQAPSETPEHNIAQASFLDVAYCLRFLRAAWPNLYRVDVPRIEHVSMESCGADVRLVIHYKTEFVLTEEEYAKKSSYYWGSTKPGRHEYNERIEAYVEIKPSLGDDYPAVLRQIKNSKAYKSPSSERVVALLVGTYSGSITREMLEAYFMGDQIRVVFEDKL